MFINDVDVVLPTYNRAKVFDLVIESYFRDPAVRQIILVDDCSSVQNSAQYVKTAARYPGRVTYIRNSARLGQQRCRTVGLAKVRTSLMMFGEDDVWLGSNYVTSLRNRIVFNGIDIIAGRLVDAHIGTDLTEEILARCDKPQNTEVVFDVKRLSSNYSVRIPDVINAPYLHTIAAINMRVFDKISFDVRYGGNAHREETDFYMTAVSMGFKVKFTSEVTAFHIRGPLSGMGGHRDAGINYLYTEFWIFLNTFRLLRKHWKMLHDKFGFRGFALYYMLTSFAPARLKNSFRKIRRRNRAWGK
jgi:glycosyltransferase involved in cell wall biosynthesis